MSEARIIATATEIQNNFGRYLQYAMDNGEVVIMKNGKRVARIVADDAAIGFLSDKLLGVIKNDYSLDEVKAERREKYEDIH